MVMYWALDYVDDEYCELVLGDQLYISEEEAAAARETLSEKENIEVNWYTLRDLEDDIYGREIYIGPDLHIKS